MKWARWAAEWAHPKEWVEEDPVVLVVPADPAVPAPVKEWPEEDPVVPADPAHVKEWSEEDPVVLADPAPVKEWGDGDPVVPVDPEVLVAPAAWRRSKRSN